MANIYIYHTSPNQRSVITKKTQSDKEHIYGICNIEAALTAARELTDRAYKLYSRMSLHQDGHTYALSPAEIFNSIGMSDKRYREAVKELIDKGYLVHHNKHKNVLIFYEAPHIDNVAILPTATAYHAKTPISYSHNEYIAPINREAKAAKSGVEIIDNITSQIHNNTDSTLSDRCLITKKENNFNGLFESLQNDDLPF